MQSTDKINQLLTSVIPEKASIIGRHDETTTETEEIELLEKLKSGSLIGIVSSDVFSVSALETVPIVEEIAFCHLTAQLEDFFRRCKPVATSKGRHPYISFTTRNRT